MLTCKVCEQPTSSVHFGVLTCRACAMYFRRSIAQNHQLKLKIKFQCDGKCEINKKFRKICKSCRFQKCLKVGMKSPFSTNLKSTFFEPGHILKSWKTGYQCLEEARAHAFGITKATVSRPSTYTTQNVVITIDFKLVITHLISGCPKFRELRGAHQKMLLSQFICPFHILESTYKSKDPDIVVLANGDHIDHNGLPKYYNDLRDSRHQLAFRVFKPYWDLQHRIIRSGLDEVGFDENEFLFLIALMLWDIDFDEVDEELITECLRQKDSIRKELCDYEKHREQQGELHEDRSLRVGRIVMILQGMQRTLNMMYESYEVSQFYQVDIMHDSFFEQLKLSA